MRFLSMITQDDVMLVVDLVREDLMILAGGLAALLVIALAAFLLRKPWRKLVRGTAGIAYLVTVVLVLNMMISGPLYSLINMVLREPTAGSSAESGDGTTVAALSESSIANAQKVAEQMAAEGFVLLKNEGALPLEKGTKVNTFGWSSTNAVYGGVGSGALNGAYETVTYLESLAEAGLEYNTTLTDWYTRWRAERPGISMWSQNWTVPEPTQEEYDAAGIYTNAKAFSDTVIFMISRSGGEGADLPTTYDDGMSEAVFDTVQGDSEYADDLDPSKHYLELTNRERATLEALNRQISL